jgi:hypothetical protein
MERRGRRNDESRLAWSRLRFVFESVLDSSLARCARWTSIGIAERPSIGGLSKAEIEVDSPP